MLDSRFSTQVTQNEGDWILLKKSTKPCGLCLGGATVRASEFRSSGHGFDSRPGRNQGT